MTYFAIMICISLVEYMYFLGAYHCHSVGDLTRVRGAIQWSQFGGKLEVKNIRHFMLFVNFIFVRGKVCNCSFIFWCILLEIIGMIIIENFSHLFHLLLASQWCALRGLRILIYITIDFCVVLFSAVLTNFIFITFC